MPVYHREWNANTHHFIIDDGTTNYDVRTADGARQPRIERSAAGAPKDLEDHARQIGNCRFEVCELDVAEFYPRIYRPPFPGPSEQFKRERANSVQAVRTLLSSLRDVFRVVEPAPANEDVFGHELRQLLILGCNEVETACRAVLKANGYARPGYWNTSDYVKLLGPMHLAEWEVAVTRYPDFPRFKPFAGWDPVSPTPSIAWYAEQHEVKHDRENAFERASLGNVMRALGAAFVLVHAQFGAFGRRGMNYETDDFWISAEPAWRLSESYVPPRKDDSRVGAPVLDQWRPVVHPALV